VVGIPILPFVLYRNSIWSRKKASSLNSIYEKSRNIPKRRSFPAKKKQRVTRAFTIHCSILRNQPGTNCSHSHTACSEYKPPDLMQTCPSAWTLPPVTPEGLTPNRIKFKHSTRTAQETRCFCYKNKSSLWIIWKLRGKYGRLVGEKNWYILRFWQTFSSLYGTQVRPH